MFQERKTYGYPPAIRRDPEVYRAINGINRNLGKAGFCLGAMTVGGIFLWRKVKELNLEVQELNLGRLEVSVEKMKKEKEETGK